MVAQRPPTAPRRGERSRSPCRRRRCIGSQAMEPLRIGTLGAARITPNALIRPPRHVPEIEVVAVAARDRDRAERFARQHKIPTAHDSDEALLPDPAVDAVL